jgi:chitinase
MSKGVRRLASWTLGIAMLLALALLSTPSWFGRARAGRSQQWSLAYRTPRGNPPIPPSEIDWSGLTHLVQWAALVRPDGTLDLETQSVITDGPALVSAGRTKNVKVLLGISQAYWQGQTTNLRQAATERRSTLVKNIISAVDTYRFDGVDLDWEPFNADADGPPLRSLVADLRQALKGKLLTAAALVTDYGYWGSVARDLDRLHIMTHDLAGTWNPYSWHNAALYDPDGSVWSVDLAVKRFTAKGVPPEKVTISIPFFGYKFTGGRLRENPDQGITRPEQYWLSPPAIQQIYYQSLAPSITPANQHWDAFARVPYLEIDDKGHENDHFFTYDDARSVTEKVDYVKSKALGGWHIWELAGDYFPSRNPKQPLLAAIKSQLTSPPHEKTE